MALTHDLPLLSTLAASLSLAFATGMLASRLRIPPIVGYLVTGIILGPHTPGMVADMKIAEELSEIGIVLLMFGVGLHFSISDLMEVRKIALPGAIVQIAAATAMGMGLAHLWGWSVQTGLIFGLALSVASTVVLLRALEEHRMQHSMNGHIAIGWLIVEDLFMVLALVLIPVLAMSEGEDTAKSALWELFVTIGKIGLFVVIMLLAGRRILPWILNAVVQTRSRELFTLCVFAAAIGIAYGASTLFGVSFALGAFFAGMMIRESDLNHEVATRALPFQDAFAVLFFVSVGMLFNPAILLEEPFKVLAVAAIIIAGKSLAAFLIVILFRYPLKTALLVSAGLAQIGEFSFILIALGMNYNMIPSEARDLILAGALISIALNPLLFRGVNFAYVVVDMKPRLRRIFNMLDDDLAHFKSEEKKTLSGHVIVAGYGRVGKHICKSLRADDRNLAVIDSNRERIGTLRDNGFMAITGDASNPDTLTEAGITNASALAIAVPDYFEAQRILQSARLLNPSIKVMVRAHNDEEMDYFRSKNVDMASTGAREIGEAMARSIKNTV